MLSQKKKINGNCVNKFDWMEKEYCRKTISGVLAAQHKTIENCVENIDIDSVADLVQV